MICTSWLKICASSAKRLVAAAVLLLLTAGAAGAQAPVAHRDITYILPVWTGFGGATPAALDLEVQELRTRIGEGSYVKVGFSVYIFVSMDDWNVDITDPAALRAALASTFAQVDTNVAKANAAGIPICLNILTAIRDRYDPVQTASEAEDRRSMQWYSDNELAPGWWSHSRYARKARAVQEAYVRELGRYLAKMMTLYPDTLVAASGDGEVELSYYRSPLKFPDRYTEATTVLADYSPFALAEFRDWLRKGGLYASDPAFANQSYEFSARYEGDASPAQDTNGNGHTLNGDFGTSFTSWNLRYADWSLTDSPLADPNAIPLVGGTVRDAGENAGQFDAPRVRAPGNAWWEAWALFRQMMIWRHNRDFARWITTTVDPDSGTPVSTDRWYSYQIATDYLFGHTPANPDFRFITSASPWWSADISPYGGLGITAFNINLNEAGLGAGPFAKTLANVAPLIAARNVRWGILEWNPSIPPSTTPDVYREEMDIIERYRPTLLVPYKWEDPGVNHSVTKGTLFETALKELVGRIAEVPPPVTPDPIMTIDTPQSGVTLTQPFLLAGWAIDRGKSAGSGVDTVHVWAFPSSGSPVFVGVANYFGRRDDVAAAFGSARFVNSGFNITVTGLSPGTYTIVAYAHSAVSGTFNQALAVTVTIPSSSSSLPAMSLDGPADGATVEQTFNVGGWAIDRGAATGTGVSMVHVWAFPVGGGSPIFLGVPAYGEARGDVGAVFGSQFTNSGFFLTVNNLAPGTYRIVAYARSTVADAFNQEHGATITVTDPRMSIDAPDNGATVSADGFLVGGWAIDRGATSGTGVDTVHVWAFPVGGGSPDVFVGVATYPGGVARGDVGAVFGSQFTNSGYNLVVTGIPSGTYDIGVYARSTVTGTFNQARFVRVIVP